MKFKKFAAALTALLMFIIFMGFGYILINEPAQEIKYEYKYVQTPIYVSDITHNSVLAYGIGVHDDNKTGELVEINITSELGSGRVFFDTTFHSYGTDLQDSLPKIIKCAEKNTGKSFDSFNIIINLRSEAHTVEGTSGGAALGTGLIALLENKTLRNDAAITGTLDENCRIGSISEIKLKIKVAAENGIKKMIVPESQCDELNETNEIEVVCVENARQALDEMTR